MSTSDSSTSSSDSDSTLRRKSKLVPPKRRPPPPSSSESSSESEESSMASESAVESEPEPPKKKRKQERKLKLRKTSKREASSESESEEESEEEEAPKYEVATPLFNDLRKKLENQVNEFFTRHVVEDKEQLRLRRLATANIRKMQCDRAKPDNHPPKVKLSYGSKKKPEPKKEESKKRKAVEEPLRKKETVPKEEPKQKKHKTKPASSSSPALPDKSKCALCSAVHGVEYGRLLEKDGLKLKVCKECYDNEQEDTFVCKVCDKVTPESKKRIHVFGKHRIKLELCSSCFTRESPEPKPLPNDQALEKSKIAGAVWKRKKNNSSPAAAASSPPTAPPTPVKKRKHEDTSVPSSDASGSDTEEEDASDDEEDDEEVADERVLQRVQKYEAEWKPPGEDDEEFPLVLPRRKRGGFPDSDDPDKAMFVLDEDRGNQVTHTRIIAGLAQEFGVAIDGSPFGTGKGVVAMVMGKGFEDYTPYDAMVIITKGDMMVAEHLERAERHGTPVAVVVPYSQLTGQTTKGGRRVVAKGLLIREDKLDPNPQLKKPRWITTFTLTKAARKLFTEKRILLLLDEAHNARNKESPRSAAIAAMVDAFIDSSTGKRHTGVDEDGNEIEMQSAVAIQTGSLYSKPEQAIPILQISGNLPRDIKATPLFKRRSVKVFGQKKARRKITEMLGVEAFYKRCREINEPLAVEIYNRYIRRPNEGHSYPYSLKPCKGKRDNPVMNEKEREEVFIHQLFVKIFLERHGHCMPALKHPGFRITNTFGCFSNEEDNLKFRVALGKFREAQLEEERVANARLFTTSKAEKDKLPSAMDASSEVFHRHKAVEESLVPLAAEQALHILRSDPYAKLVISTNYIKCISGRNAPTKEPAPDEPEAEDGSNKQTLASPVPSLIHLGGGQALYFVKPDPRPKFIVHTSHLKNLIKSSGRASDSPDADAEGGSKKRKRAAPKKTIDVEDDNPIKGLVELLKEFKPMILSGCVVPKLKSKQKREILKRFQSAVVDENGVLQDRVIITNPGMIAEGNSLHDTSPDGKYTRYWFAFPNFKAIECDQQGGRMNRWGVSPEAHIYFKWMYGRVTMNVLDKNVRELPPGDCEQYAIMERLANRSTRMKELHSKAGRRDREYAANYEQEVQIGPGGEIVPIKAYEFHDNNDMPDREGAVITIDDEESKSNEMEDESKPIEMEVEKDNDDDAMEERKEEEMPALSPV